MIRKLIASTPELMIVLGLANLVGVFLFLGPAAGPNQPKRHVLQILTRGTDTMKILLSLMVTFFAGSAPVIASTQLVYVGTYTNRELLVPERSNAPGERSQGIHAFRFDAETGALTPLGLAAQSVNPTYVTFSPSGEFLYTTNELYEFAGEPSGAVSAFRVDRTTGQLTFLNQVSSRGTGACHASIDATGRNLLVANFGGGSVAALPLNPDGTLRPAAAFIQHHGSGPHARQAGPHAHAINLTPDNRLAIASAFGTDQLLLYRFEARAGTLAPATPPFVTLPAGSAPRHLAFHPDGRVAYSINEIDSTITALDYAAPAGTLYIRQTLSTLPAGFAGRSTAAEIVVHPSGRFLYGSNRGHHSIAVFAVAGDGALTAIAHVPCGGRTPRGFSVDPTGRWLIVACQDTHNLAVFALDPDTGVPSPTDVRAGVHTPVCVTFLPPEAVRAVLR